MAHHLIIGNGIAANSAARRIRDLQPEARITLVTDEREPYFSRCALMYYVMDHCSKRDLYLHDGQHHHDLGAQLIFDRVLSVDPSAAVVRLQMGGALAYDTLLMASGARPRRLGVPGEEARGVFDFTTLPDADGLRTWLREARRGVVVGGGLIGSEVIEVLCQLGLEVDFILREPYFYPVFCSEDQGLICQRDFEKHGVRVHVGRSVARVESDERGDVCAVIDDQGTRHECDVVVRAIGVDPNVAFLEGSGIGTDVGVVVDERLRTNVPNVFAAGDCAELHLLGGSKPMVQKLWYTAQPQGWVAGENMAGGQATYDPGPDYQSAMFMDLDFCSYGQMPARQADYPRDENITSANELDSLRLVHDGQVVVGASFLGTALTKEDVEHWVVMRTPLREAMEAARKVLGPRRHDRAPVSRVTPQRRWSRLPNLWPRWARGGDRAAR